jgi:hypothetical protein
MLAGCAPPQAPLPGAEVPVALIAAPAVVVFVGPGPLSLERLVRLEGRTGDRTSVTAGAGRTG